MATLHVRNVPEPLYEALRRCAEENGRSIGAQAIALLNESLSTGRRGFPFFGQRSRGTATPFRAFGEVARSAIADAQTFAHDLGYDHIGTEHVLLALLAQPQAGIAEAVAPLGLTLQAVRSRVAEGPGAAGGPIRFGPDAKKALELALRESLQVRATTIEPAHLLLGLARAGGEAERVLAELGIDADALRLPLLVRPEASRLVPHFKVIELEGSADEWAGQLNEACDGPYALVEIVGQRAVFAVRRPE
jgi:ATP-dependent Clp protease ATP-binding subunit ClpC